MDGNSSRVRIMFRKKQVKILRVKDGEKRLVNFDIPWELTYSYEVKSFLKDRLKLDSFQILNAGKINLFDAESSVGFRNYFFNNETVDILIPNSVDLDGWELQRSRYV